MVTNDKLRLFSNIIPKCSSLIGKLLTVVESPLDIFYL